MSPTRRTDLEPLHLVVSSLIRRLWLIAGATALVGAGTYLATGLGAEDTADRTATARVGITTEAVWPFYDVVLEQGRIFIDDPAFETELEAELGYAITDIRTVIPDKLSVFDIEVIADTGEQAVSAADLAARKVVEQDIAQLDQERTASIAAMDQEISDLEARIAELEVRITDATAQITAITEQQAQSPQFDPVLDEQKYPFTTSRDIDQAVSNDLVRELATKQSQRSALAAASEPDPRFQVLRLAEAPELQTSTRVPVAIAAGVAVLLLASALIVAFDRRRGALRSAWQLREICGAPQSAELRIADGGLQGAGILIDELSKAVDEDQRIIGLVDTTSRGMPFDDLVSEISANGIPALLTDQPHAEPGHAITFVDVTDEYRDPDAPRPRTYGCDSLIMFFDDRRKVPEVSAMLERAGTAPGLLAAVLVKNR